MHVYLLATHLSSDGNLAAWVIDRMLPSLFSGLIVAVVAWWLSRSFKTHVEATTITQTEEIKRETAAQTQVIEEITNKQTKELKSRGRRAQSPPSPPRAE